MNWFAAQTKLASARSESAGKPLENNTRLFRRGEDFAVRLHETDVVTIHRDGTYTLNSGGWRTLTTKDRINRYSPARVWQHMGVWNVRGEGGAEVLFEDGMRVDADGFPVGRTKDAAEVYRLKGRLDRAVRRYVKDYVAHALEYVGANGAMELPRGGDCWGCYFTSDDHPAGKPHGDAMGWGHILEHLRDGYYVPSLFWNAIRSRVYRDPSLVWRMTEDYLRRGRGGFMEDILRSYFKRVKPRLMELIDADTDLSRRAPETAA